MTTKSTAFIFTLGFIIHRLYSTCRSPAEANIGLKTIVQSAIGKQVSIQDWLTTKGRQIIIILIIMQFMKNVTQAPCDALNPRKAKARKIKTTPMYCDVCPLLKAYGGPVTLSLTAGFCKNFITLIFWLTSYSRSAWRTLSLKLLNFWSDHRNSY